MIELRSDTFTLPSPAMLQSIVDAPLGDDVYGEDPTVSQLEKLAAEVMGKEAACLFPSGTMANLSAIMAHVPRGATVLVGSESDVYRYEAGGASVCGGIVYRPIPNQPDGQMPPVSLLTFAIGQHGRHMSDHLCVRPARNLNSAHRPYVLTTSRSRPGSRAATSTDPQRASSVRRVPPWRSGCGSYPTLDLVAAGTVRLLDDTTPAVHPHDTARSGCRLQDEGFRRRSRAPTLDGDNQGWHIQ
jgi:hypothetical protein